MQTPVFRQAIDDLLCRPPPTAIKGRCISQRASHHARRIACARQQRPDVIAHHDAAPSPDTLRASTAAKFCTRNRPTKSACSTDVRPAAGTFPPMRTRTFCAFLLTLSAFTPTESRKTPGVAHLPHPRLGRPRRPDQRQTLPGTGRRRLQPQLLRASNLDGRPQNAPSRADRN